MFYEKITKQDLSYISVCSLSILYNSKFILMATSWGLNKGSLYVSCTCAALLSWTFLAYTELLPIYKFKAVHFILDPGLTEYGLIVIIG